GSSDEDPAREADVLRAFAVRRVDGLIVVPASQDLAVLALERRLGKPIVFVDRRPALQGVDSVTVDNRAGIASAGAHLAADAHRRIAYLGDLSSIWTATERHLGYVEGLTAQGIKLDPTLVRQDVHGVEEAEAAVLGLLDHSTTPPTALLTGQNLITVGAIRALQRQGLQRRVAAVRLPDLPVARPPPPPPSPLRPGPAPPRPAAPAA